MVTSIPSIPPTFALGVCDHPEHVPCEQWELGITYVRVAEFAWSRIEPREGAFEWGWLDEAAAFRL